MPTNNIVAIIPCNDLDASEAFYRRLGFARPAIEASAEGEADSYRMLADGKGAEIHLTGAAEGMLTPGQNPFGLYLYSEEVDALAEGFRGETIEEDGPEDKPWGMHEFSLSDPDETLVRVGWPIKWRTQAAE